MSQAAKAYSRPRPPVATAPAPVSDARRTALLRRLWAGHDLGGNPL